MKGTAAMKLKSFAKKHFEKVLLAAVIIGFAAIGNLRAGGVVYNNTLVNETGLAFNQTYALNLNNYGIDTVSFQVVYGSMSPITSTFTDGTQSTSTITLVQAGSVVALTTSTASDFLTVLTTTSLSGASIVVAGVTLKEGQQWLMDTTASTWTAISIKNAINTYVANVVASTGVTSSLGVGTNRAVVVFATSTFAGSSANSMTFTSNNSSVVVNAANFSGGNDNGCFSINNIPLCANIDFAVGTSSKVTAFNIATAINANTSLSAIVTSTAPLGCNSGAQCGVVRSTSVLVGTSSNYAMYSSTKTALLLAGGTVTSFVSSSTMNMFGGTNSASSLNSGRVTLTGHGYTTALPVLYTTSSAAGLTGLVWGTTYFIIPLDANTVELATTSANAQAGLIFAVVTSSSAQTTAHSFVLTPLAISGASSYKYQGSNDGSTWTDLTTPAAYTIGTGFVFPTTSTVVDVGSINFSQIRLNVTAPTQGGLVLKVIPNGKNSSLAIK